MVSGEPISTESPIQATPMTPSSDQNPTFTLITQPSSATDKPLITLNITAQLNEKLTPSTFSQWRAQFEALLIGYNLLDYVEGTLQFPSSVGTAADALHKTHWVRQDKLILSAILVSTSSSITPLIATAKTSHEAWKKLKNLYASRSRTRAMQLKEELTLIQRGNRSITEYLHSVKALADEIAIIDHSISDDDLTLYVLNGLGPDFQEIAVPIRAQESSLAFEELHGLLVGHEAYLRRLEASMQQLVSSANFTKTKQSTQGGNQSWSFKKNDAARGTQGFIPGRNNHGAQRDGRRSNNNSGKPSNSNRRYQPKCQLCDQLGHIAKYCPKFNSHNVSINCATSSNGKDKNWLLDSVASHNITGDLSNLSINSEYDGTDEVTLGNGSDPQTLRPSDLTKGPPAIVTYSPSNFKPPISLLHDSFHALDHTISNPSPPLDENRNVSSLNLPPPPPIISMVTHIAMSTELTALMKHGTWDLVLPPSNCQPVGCKWVFRVKRKAMDRFKALLVAKGYHQLPGVDYKETFSHVVKPTTIRDVLSIAVMNGWDLRKLDVNNAFLNGKLTETVFMAQTPGFKDLSKPHHVCRLNKVIYGLKQDPWAWYTALKNAIIQMGFQNSNDDSSLFIYSQDSTLCYFIVYVDDLLITGNNSTIVANIIKQLGDMFSLKDMGSLHFFLGIEVIPTRAGLFLS
ncbi:Detected protein of unknown function [Hibiscus syriacus]|uniref:Reverse transcriptase Ty1/copia-type domain-containing protein n=1 Tax=Hibiscus syriacus TaxID=106335 RepID=A0A6A2YTD5_HIBSY|nr:Detected protein of unknown function [Hibiscus syriacus]